ncbi:hypothetical protein LTR95_014568 [Oleoguttula sp. CCFEE 5521]
MDEAGVDDALDEAVGLGMVMKPVLKHVLDEEAPAGPVGYQADELDWMGRTELVLDAGATELAPPAVTVTVSVSVSVTVTGGAQPDEPEPEPAP